jgi:hypothetical protein
MTHRIRQFGKLIGRGLTVVWLLTIVTIVFLNLRLYSSSPLATKNDDVPPMLLAQLAANRAALDAGSPSQMQTLFPEGYYFSYLFHGLAWVELAMRDQSYSEQAIQEALWCLARLDSPQGRAPFPPHLPPDHGMFYSAWKCSLRAGVVVVQQGNDASQIHELRKECDAIVLALQGSETPFLASYDGAAWPCDTVPSCLSRHSGRFCASFRHCRRTAVGSPRIPVDSNSGVGVSGCRVEVPVPSFHLRNVLSAESLRHGR